MRNIDDLMVVRASYIRAREKERRARKRVSAHRFTILCLCRVISKSSLNLKMPKPEIAKIKTEKKAN